MKKIFVLFLLLSIMSCFKRDVNVFFVDQLRIEELEITKELEGKLIPIQNFGAVNLFVADTFIVFTTPQLDTLYSVVSTKSNKHIGNFVARGQAADEFLAAYEPSFFKEKNDTVSLFFYDYLKRKITSLNLTETIKEQKAIVTTNNLKLDKISNIYEIFLLDEEHFFINYLDIEDNLIQHYSVYNTEEKEFTKDTQALISNINDAGNSYLLASSCCFNLSKRKYASAMKFLDQINIYDITNEEESFSISTNSNQLRLYEVEKVSMPEKLEFYNDLRSTDSLLFGLYVNQNRKDWSLENIPAVIHVFDWDGRPIAKLTTKEKIIVFDIDTQKNSLYGMTSDESFYEYSLDGIFNLKD